MPTYEYGCPDCGAFEALRPMAQRADPVACPACGLPAPRVVLTAPGLARVAATTRTAIERNERSAHAPRSTSRDGPAETAGRYSRLGHRPGCGCCGSSRHRATVTSADGARAFPSRRPWMISH